MAEEQQAPQMAFHVEKIYVKDLSLEVPNAPAIFLEREVPQVSVELGTLSNVVGEDAYESSIKVTVTASLGEKTMYLVECEQAGIFRIAGLSQDQLALALGIGCPNILFPYAREAVASTIMRAGFPPLQLDPVNFEAEFMLRQQQAAAQAQGGTH